MQPRSAGFDRALQDAQVELRARRADGRLVRDAGPSATALVATEHLPAGPRDTLGVILAVELRAGGSDAVLPHERTFEDPVARRRRTREMLRVESVPSLLVLREPVPGMAELLAEAMATAPAIECSAGGVDQRAVALGGELVASLVAGLRGVPALVADGHHRLAAAEASSVAPGTAMTWLTAAEAPPRLLPVHRIVHRLDVDAVERLERDGIGLEPCAPRPDPDAAVLVTSQGAWRLSVRDSTAAAAAAQSWPAVLRSLPTMVGQYVLHTVLGLSWRREAVGTTTDADEALALVAGAGADGALLASGPELQDVWAAAEQGVRMPPKATWFSPKPFSGGILRILPDDGHLE